MQVSSFCWVAVRGSNNWYGYNHHPFRNLSLGFILNIFLKLCKFQPRYSYKIFSYRKKRVYNNKKILVAKPNYWSKQRPRLNFWKWAPFINIKLRPLCDRQRSYFWKVKSLKKKLSLRSSSIHNLIAAKKNKQKNKCRSLKAMKNIAWNSPSKMNLFPLVKARFSGKWFVLCSLKYRVNYTETRHWFVELSNTIIERTAILFLQCGRFVCVGLSWKHERKKKNSNIQEEHII